MEQQVLDHIVDAIVRKMIERSRKLLLLYTGSPLGLDVIDPQLDELKREGYTFSVYATAAATRILDIDGICARLDAENCSDTTYAGGFLDKGYTLLVPTLTQNTAAKWALGINDNPAMDILADALQRGYEAVASTEGCCPMSPSRKKVGLGNAPRAYRKMMQDNLQSLEDFGVRLTPPEGFMEKVREATKIRIVRPERYTAPKVEPDPVMHVGSSFRYDMPKEAEVKEVFSKIITLSDVITLKKGDTVELDPKAILTPSAREYVRDQQIQIVRRK